MREFRACRRGDPEAWKPPSQFKMRLGKAKRLVRRIPPLFVPQLARRAHYSLICNAPKRRDTPHSKRFAMFEWKRTEIGMRQCGPRF